MHRTAVLALLEEYVTRGLGPHEAALATQVRDFVLLHPDCFLRSCLEGHLTGSAWIVDGARSLTLLTHHRKLEKWLQLGGHADGDTDLAAVALKEAREESGLKHLRFLSKELLDVDCHRIPERKGVPAHWHLDLRFLVEADPAEPLVLSQESKELAWVPLEHVERLNPDESMLRLVRKTPRPALL